MNEDDLLRAYGLKPDGVVVEEFPTLRPAIIRPDTTADQVAFRLALIRDNLARQTGRLPGRNRFGESREAQIARLAHQRRAKVAHRLSTSGPTRDDGLSTPSVLNPQNPRPYDEYGYLRENDERGERL